jgi:protein-S-isoprenylcysteine O-methyltransferase Ste14
VTGPRSRHRCPPRALAVRLWARRIRTDPEIAAALPGVLVLSLLALLLLVAVGVLLAAPDLLSGFGAAAAVAAVLLYLQVHREGVRR